MRLNRKQKLFIYSLFFLILGIGIYLYSNKPRNLNVILITIDSLRPDHLGCYGYKTDISPNIDKLAENGILFTQVISQASWTLPSIYSLITGTYPSTHGVNFFDQILAESIPNLPQILKKINYFTAFISGHGGLSRFNLGFDTFRDISGDAEKITQEALTWLKKNRNKKFFLWIHYMDTHDKSLGIIEEKHFIKNITKDEIKTYSLRYDRAISYVDNQVAILLKNLKELKLYKNTIIFITADHGQEMCEHGICFNHGGFLWDSVIKAPLIILYPNFFSKNKIITQQVQQIDIMPTICDLLNIKQSKIFEGKSLLPLIEKNSPHSTYAFSEHIENKGDLSKGRWIYTKFSLRTPEWKLIKTVNRVEKEYYEFYNLKNDPQELNNLIETEKEQFEFLRAKLEEWIKRPKPDITPLTKSLDEKTKERLKNLGYLQ